MYDISRDFRAAGNIRWAVIENEAKKLDQKHERCLFVWLFVYSVGISNEVDRC